MKCYCVDVFDVFIHVLLFLHDMLRTYQVRFCFSRRVRTEYLVLIAQLQCAGGERGCCCYALCVTTLGRVSVRLVARTDKAMASVSPHLHYVLFFLYYLVYQF